jgi:PAS domain S-box-containing protein
MVANSRIVVVERDPVAGQRVSGCLVAMGFEVFLIVEPTEKSILRSEKEKPVLILLGDVSGDRDDALLTLDRIATRLSIPVISLPPGPGCDPGMNDLPGKKAPVPLHSDEPFHSTHSHPASYLVEMESGAQEQKDWYRIIAELVPDPIFIVNRDRILEYANNAALIQFGERDAFVFGTPYQQVLTGNFIKSLDTPLSRIFRWGGNIRRTDEIVMTGGKKWFDTTLVPLKDNNGEVGSVLIVCCDTTVRVQTADRLREFDIIRIERQNEQILELNDEIRNPLQVIRSLIEFEEIGPGEKILEQIARIDSIIQKLDQGWLESEKVMKYLSGHPGKDPQICRDRPHLAMGGTKGAYDLSR